MTFVITGRITAWNERHQETNAARLPGAAGSQWYSLMFLEYWLPVVDRQAGRHRQVAGFKLHALQKLASRNRILCRNAIDL
jgi:hypothetical protein